MDCEKKKSAREKWIEQIRQHDEVLAEKLNCPQVYEAWMEQMKRTTDCIDNLLINQSRAFFYLFNFFVAWIVSYFAQSSFVFIALGGMLVSLFALIKARKDYSQKLKEFFGATRQTPNNPDKNGVWI